MCLPKPQLTFARRRCWIAADNQLWTQSSVRQEEAGRSVLPVGASVSSGQAIGYGAVLTASRNAADPFGGQ
jgi:hypothetical protein